MRLKVCNCKAAVVPLQQIRHLSVLAVILVQGRDVGLEQAFSLAVGQALQHLVKHAHKSQGKHLCRDKQGPSTPIWHIFRSHRLIHAPECTNASMPG